MLKATQKSGRAVGCAVSLLVFCAGVVVFFLVPVLGWIAGPLLCIIALFIGAKRQKVWRCEGCHAFVPRG